MVSAVPQPSTIPVKRTGMVPAPARFGTGSSQVASKAVKVAHLGIAEFLQKGFSRAKKDVRIGGLSLEDMAGRLLTLIGIYIPQGYFAIKDEKHPWETNGRNAVVWLMTIALTSLTKSENHGVNTLLLNPWMQQKGSAGRFLQFLPFLKHVVDPLRMKVDYLDILENAGIPISSAEKEGATQGKKALWASSWLDANKLEKIQNRYKDLQKKAEQALKKNKKLSPADQRMLEAIPSFFKRINLFNFVSVGLITAATVYFIGGVAMRIVNKVFSPLDKDYEGPNARKAFGSMPSGLPPRPPAPGFPIRAAYGYNARFMPPATQRGHYS